MAPECITQFQSLKNVHKNLLKCCRLINLKRLLKDNTLD